MNKRFTKFVFENADGTPFESIAPKGKKFEITEGLKDELVIKVIEEHSSKNYANPPIPKGYKHTEGEWDNGFIIQRISDGIELVWIPVGFLDTNEMIDNEFSKNEFYPSLAEGLRMTNECIKKYGGFYISRYPITSSKDGKLQSQKGISYRDAEEFATQFENDDELKSHLPYLCEYNYVFKWIIKCKVRTLPENVNDLTKWRYGNIEEFVQGGRKDSSALYFAGGFRDILGYGYSLAYLLYHYPFYTDHCGWYFRVTLLIK